MFPHLAYVFIDGAYLRKLAHDRNLKAPNPLHVGQELVRHGKVQTWAYDPSRDPNALLGRITYYDAIPDDEDTLHPELDEYWKAIELLDDVHLGFGALKGLKKNKLRQKGVDALIAVDMLAGAFSNLFDIAILLAGDADFVPIVEEVKRRGVMVSIAADLASLSDELRRSADRILEISPGSSLLQPMNVRGRTFDPWPGSSKNPA